MSDNDAPKKLVGLLVPESASSTRQGPRLRGEKGHFTSGDFESVKLTVLPDEAVQWLFESLPLVIEGILMLDDRLDELQGAVARVQQGVDQIIFRLDRDLRVELEYVCKLLKRADGKGEGARGYLAENERHIIGPLRKVEMEVEKHLADAGLPPEVRVCLMKRFLMLRHVRAKVSLACEEGGEARELLQEARNRILPLARALFAALTNGVAVLDAPEVNSVGAEVKLLQLMEIVDGVPPDCRRFEMRKSTPLAWDKVKLVDLAYRKNEQKAYASGFLHVNPGEMVRKGQVIFSEQGYELTAKTCGYLIIRNFDLPYQMSGAGYNYHASDLAVLEIPTLEVPRPGLVDLIASIAFIVDYACGLEQEMDLASGNGELAKRLFAPDSA